MKKKYNALKKLSVMVWIVSRQISYVEALAPNVTIFEDRTYKEVIKVKWG